MFTRFALVLPLALSACMSTANDPVYRQIDWTKSEAHKLCKTKEDQALLEYKAAKLAHDNAQSNYDYDAELKNFEQEMAKYEAGERKIMPLRPSVIGPAGLGPMLPKLGQCLMPPEGWVPE